MNSGILESDYAEDSQGYNNIQRPQNNQKQKPNTSHDPRQKSHDLSSASLKQRSNHSGVNESSVNEEKNEALQRPYNPRQNQTPNGQKPTRSKSGVLESDSSDEDSQKVIHRNANGLKQTSNSENNQRQKPNGTNSDWNSRPNQGGAEYAPKVEVIHRSPNNLGHNSQSQFSQRPRSGKNAVLNTEIDQDYREDSLSHRSPNGIRQRSYKSGIDEILLLEEKIALGPGSEQVRVPVDILALDDIEDLESFSITMIVKVNTNLKDLKYDQIFFQVASSAVNKTLILGISRDKTFYVSCVTRKNKIETCYTQCQVKNSEYQVGVIVCNEGSFSEVTIFVNGKNEASMVFPSHIDTFQGDFMFGSDSSIGGFQGEISDPIFYIKVLNPTEMKDCFTSKTLMRDKSTYQIRKEKQAYLDTTEYYSKKKGVPVNLVRSQEIEKQKIINPQFQEENKEKETQRYINDEEKNKEIVTKMIEDLKDYLYQDEELFLISQELACNFEWVFNVCSVLSPVIEESGLQPKHAFKCLHSSLCEIEARFYPCYAITIDQFMKVLGKTDSKFQRDDILNMAERINCLDIHQEYGNFIYFDKFLIALRNATLTKEEIKNISKTKAEEIDKQIIKSESPQVKRGEQIITNVVAYNLIPIFEGADYFDQKEFIEQNPGATLIKIIITIDRANNHIKYMHFTYKLRDGQIREYEVGKPLLGLTGKDLVHFTIDINDNEVLTSVKASNFHSNNANKVINYLSFGLNTHPEGIAYGQFVGHPGELKAVSFNPNECETKKILGFYGAFRDDLVGIGVYVEETTILKSEEQEKVLTTQKEEIVNEDDEEYVLDVPNLNPDWNEGRIQIVINRCAECIKHRSTTSHEEADYCVKFNDWGNRIKDYFPNTDIIGNYDKPKVFGLFEIYVRGVGPQSERDEEGRIFLHQNYTSPDKKTKFDKVLETLVLYAFEYGGSIEMAKAQDLYLQNYAKNIPKKWSESHEHPVDIPEKIHKSPKRNKGKIEDGTSVVCKHWACGARFIFDSMSETICQHHPGRYEFGSVHGLWPESWTCCRGAWEDPGCKKGKHDIIPANKLNLLCVNHGDINPKSEHPDSACGRAYQDTGDECKYHQGYLLAKGKNAKWSCCGEFGENAPPCVLTTHRNAEWPEEDAKKYFFTREVTNPGVHREVDNPNKFSKKATSSGFYKKIKPYTIYEDPYRKRLRKMEATENEPRICTNWGCGKTYKEAENKKIRTCLSHHGKWDFGYTGITVSQATTEFLREQSDIVLWKPHWTCCRQPWAAAGCTKTYHRGELANETIQPKYKWPNEDAQKFFRKTISNLWKQKLGTRYQLDSKQVSQKFDEYAKKYCGGSNISLGFLPQLCDKLHLPLLVISEDLSPHIRFLQVVHHTAEQILDDGQGNIDKKKFLDWWFAKLDE